jgi:hypothetical protein
LLGGGAFGVEPEVDVRAQGLYHHGFDGDVVFRRGFFGVAEVFGTYAEVDFLSRVFFEVFLVLGQGL